MAFVTPADLAQFSSVIENRVNGLHDQTQAALQQAKEAIDTKIIKKFNEANENFQNERARVEERINNMTTAVGNMAGKDVRKIAEDVRDSNARADTFTKFLAEMHRNETDANNQRFFNLNMAIKTHKKHIEDLTD